MAGREGFDLSCNAAKQLDDIVGVIVEQVEAMEDLWDDIIEISTKHVDDDIPDNNSAVEVVNH